MSVRRPLPRHGWRLTFVPAACALAAWLVGQVTGFQDWIARMPAASTAYHAFGVLAFGGFGLLALLLARRREDGAPDILGWAVMAFCLLAALFHAAMLLGLVPGGTA